MKEEIISQRDKLLSQISLETQFTQDQRFDLEADIIRSVRGKDKTFKSSWVVGSGPVLKKKDRVALSLAQEHSAGPSENDILWEQNHILRE